ncbi:MAG TPA: DUF1360 domain-containing protein [Phycisphaerae bacterium]|nr:DUF1360 domain-containing protein [Phycisphaerae bacterium]
MRFYWLTLGILATWRITHLLQAEDGPWNLMARLRHAVGQGFWGHLLDCFYCLSLWVALPLALTIGQDWVERPILWLALSAGSIALERLLPEKTPPALYSEDQETNHVLLRQESGDVSSDQKSESHPHA